MVLMKLRWRFLKRWVSNFNDFFFEKFKFTIVPYGETKNLNYLESDRKGVKFGIRR